MKLIFTCPVKQKTFSSKDYFLKGDYAVETDENGGKQLRGTVGLHSGCPICGGDHDFTVEQVVCPLTKEGENAEEN